MKRTKALGFAAVFTLAGLIIGLALSSNLNIQTNGYTINKEIGEGANSIPEQSVSVLSKVSEAMVDVVSAVRPSVVNISTTRVSVRQGFGSNPFMDDPFFRRFFGDDLFRQFDAPREERTSNLGSGVIVREDGYILTNNHVVKDADEIKVTLYDKGEFKGKVIGTDPKTDLAVVRIETDGLKPLKWGDSEKLKVGEMVIAVGSPYGLSQTVTSGIVSAKGRANVRIADYEDFIQTDAAINPGNSGGPLINIKGELIGINTAIFSTSGGYQGIGFSIPSNMARTVLDSLIKEGKVVRGWLGVSIQEINKELAEQFKLEGEQGALISDVFEDSPASKAGMERGDLIVEYDGKKVDNPLELRTAVASTAPGKTVNITVIRNGKRKTLNVVISELPDKQAGVSGEYENILKGVHVQGLTPELRKSLNLSARVQGVVVTDAPERTGLRRGDVISEINRKTLDGVSSYDKIVSGIKAGDDVLLLINRGGSVFYMTLKENR